MQATTTPAEQDLLIPDWLPRRAVDIPDHLALVAGSDAQALRWTWRDLDRRTEALAKHLSAQSIGPGDRVAVLLANGPLYLLAVHALIRLRAVLVPLNVRLTPEELRRQMAQSAASLLLHEATKAVQAKAIGDGPRVQLEPGGPEPDTGADRAAPLPQTRLDLAAVHCIMSTSGTAGGPKGALLTYGNHWWNAMGSAITLGLQPHDRWLACLPFFHVGGLSIVLRGAIYGITVVLPERESGGSGFDAEAVNRAIDQQGVTLVSLVSTMLARLIEARGSRPFPAALRCVLLGGGPAPRPLLEECARRGLPVAQTYGLTETASQCATLAPADALRKLGSAGRPLLPNELRILPEGGSPGEGEILVRGPSVTAGYLPAGDEGAVVPAVDGEGWLHTGDLGYLDGDGYLFVLDRRTDLIISGGENISPSEVEGVLQSHPGVAEAAVYGVPDAHWGQRPAALVVVRPGENAEPTDLLAFCRARLAAYKVPDRLRVVESLPRNAAGKLLRRRLREEAAAE